MTRRSRRSRGSTMLYCTVMLISLIAFCSLAVDYGRVQLVKRELERCADASALACLASLQSSGSITTAQAQALAMAAANTVDGQVLALDVNNDIEFGNYDSVTDTFTVLYGTDRTSATAIHIICRRIASRGTAVGLYFAPVIGISSSDATADSVATMDVPSQFGIVGINSLTVDNCDIDSYDSTLGAYGGSNVHGNAPLASSGNITFSHSCHIHSEAHPGAGASITKDGGTQINQSTPFNSGSYPILSPQTANLATTLYYPVVAAPATYDNSAIQSKLDASNNFTCTNTYAMPGGTYVVNNFTVNGGAINGQGKITVYVKGNFYFAGHINAYLTDTHNFLVYMINSGTTFEHVQGDNFYMSIYAPLSDVTFDNGNFWGQVIGKTLSIASSKIHYDESLRDGSVGGPSKKKWLKHPNKWKR